MKNEQSELEIVVRDKLDLRRIPQDVFAAFISALEEEIGKLLGGNIDGNET